MPIFQREALPVFPKNESAIDFAERIAVGLGKKANHNKNESLGCFLLVVSCSLASPLFVTLGEGLFWSKIVPSALSLLSVASTTWLQLRKPQSLWAIYRDCQRKLEDHIYRYRYHLAPYDVAPEREKSIAKAASDAAMEAHTRWLPLVPTPEALGRTGPTQPQIGRD